MSKSQYQLDSCRFVTYQGGRRTGSGPSSPWGWHNAMRLARKASKDSTKPVTIWITCGPAEGPSPREAIATCESGVCELYNARSTLGGIKRTRRRRKR